MTKKNPKQADIDKGKPRLARQRARSPVQKWLTDVLSSTLYLAYSTLTRSSDGHRSRRSSTRLSRAKSSAPRTNLQHRLEAGPPRLLPPRQARSTLVYRTALLRSERIVWRPRRVRCSNKPYLNLSTSRSSLRNRNIRLLSSSPRSHPTNIIALPVTTSSHCLETRRIKHRLTLRCISNNYVFPLKARPQLLRLPFDHTPRWYSIPRTFHRPPTCLHPEAVRTPSTTWIRYLLPSPVSRSSKCPILLDNAISHRCSTGATTRTANGSADKRVIIRKSPRCRMLHILSWSIYRNKPSCKPWAASGSYQAYTHHAAKATPVPARTGTKRPSPNKANTAIAHPCRRACKTLRISRRTLRQLRSMKMDRARCMCRKP